MTADTTATGQLVSGGTPEVGNDAATNTEGAHACGKSVDKPVTAAISTGTPESTGGDDSASQQPDRAGQERGATLWQEKLLPFMTIMIAGMALFFFVASFGQLIYLQRTMFQGNDLASMVPSSGLQLAEDTSFEDRIANLRWETLSALELYILQRRYHQANVLLMSRTWVRYLGFVTGMILALVGATFILGKLEEPESEIEAKTGFGSFLFRGASPGMFLAALGVILMLTTIVVHQQITVTDTPLYTPLYGGGVPVIDIQPVEPPVEEAPEKPALGPLPLEDESALPELDESTPALSAPASSDMNQSDDVEAAPGN